MNSRASKDDWTNERMNNRASKDDWPNEGMNDRASKDDWSNEGMNSQASGDAGKIDAVLTGIRINHEYIQLFINP